MQMAKVQVKSQKSGYTLVELLVVVSIMGILMTAGISSYRKFSQKQILATAVRELKSNLRLASTNASVGYKGERCPCGLGGDGACGTVDDPTISGWGATFAADQYSVYGKCTTGAAFASKVTKLPESVAINPLPPTILFKVLQQGTDRAGDVVISLKGFGETPSVTVTTGGEIR